MSVLKSHYKTIAGSILLAALLSVYFGHRSDKATVSSVKEVSPTPALKAATPSVASVASKTLSPELLTQLASRGQPTVPSQIQKLLPSIEAAITNWKEYKPQKIVIAPYPDTPMEFNVSSVREENGRTLWTGRNALQGAFLTAAATENEWQATLVIPPVGAFDIRISGQNVTVLERNAVNEQCGTSVAMGRDIAPVDTSTSSSTTGVAAADTTYTVDVLYFYDADTLAKVGTQSAFDTRMMLNVESANAALTNSNITNFHWRFLASYQIPAYTTTGDMEDDLDMITGYVKSTSGTGATIIPNAVSTFVTEKAVLHGADQSVLYVGGTRNDAGIAWISTDTTPNKSNLPFHTAVVEWNTSFSVMAHELAHNFGCHHDRQTEAAADSDGHFYYGYRFLDHSNQDTGTIMSYASFRLPYYSNPTLTVNGYVLGVADDQPKAADNARVLREAAQNISNSRATVDAPAITTQPQSASITAGQNFSLSVTATGSNLTYQWKLAGVDIAGATGATFSKTGAAVGDSGSYTVVISNIAGSVTSNAATVTVSAPVTTTTPGTTTTTTTTTAAAPAASTSSGGGGGGSVDGMFATVCGLLFLARWKLKNRS